MTNQQKAQLYDNYIYESDKLQRENSRIKSENTGNIPPHLEKVIIENERKISIIVRKLEDLFK
jgi:hypothetical protein